MGYWPKIPNLPARPRTPHDQKLFDLLDEAISIERYYAAVNSGLPKSECSLWADHMRNLRAAGRLRSDGSVKPE